MADFSGTLTIRFPFKAVDEDTAGERMCDIAGWVEDLILSTSKNKPGYFRTKDTLEFEVDYEEE